MCQDGLVTKVMQHMENSLRKTTLYITENNHCSWLWFFSCSKDLQLFHSIDIRYNEKQLLHSNITLDTMTLLDSHYNTAHYIYTRDPVSSTVNNEEISSLCWEMPIGLCRGHCFLPAIMYSGFVAFVVSLLLGSQVRMTIGTTWTLIVNLVAWWTNDFIGGCSQEPK